MKVVRRAWRKIRCFVGLHGHAREVFQQPIDEKASAWIGYYYCSDCGRRWKEYSDEDLEMGDL